MVHEKSGGRRIELYLPFEFMGKRVESITLSPLKFGHTLLWNEGHYKTMLELLVALAGVEEGVIREVRYPDTDRLMETFMLMLTPQIREDIANGVIPRQAQAQPEAPPPEQPQYQPNGGGDPSTQGLQGPGDPLPLDNQPGFDLSEEP